LTTLDKITVIQSWRQSRAVVGGIWKLTTRYNMGLQREGICLKAYFLNYLQATRPNMRQINVIIQKLHFELDFEKTRENFALKTKHFVQFIQLVTQN